MKPKTNHSLLEGSVGKVGSAALLPQSDRGIVTLTLKEEEDGWSLGGLSREGGLAPLSQ
jgi:hypothetical protein